MIYNILAISDIHWGAIEAKRLYENLNLVLDTIKYLKDKIDLVVICGDYFDYRLQLNSKSAILSLQWFDELYNVCKDSNVKRIRVVKGTNEHDNNQLEVFRVYETEDNYLKIFNTNTYEETLPDLGCLYCPDENIPTKDYMNLYLENIMKIADIGFFHGSFDIVLPDIVVQRSEETSNTNVIFEYDTFSKLIKGPIIAGHWHVSSFTNPLLYTGSFDRWKFGEEDDKGFYIVQYNTEDNSYSFEKVINKNAQIYNSISIDTSMYNNFDDYKSLIEDIDNNYNLKENKLRVVIYKSTDRDIDNDNINAFKRVYVNNKNVKIIVKDLIKKNTKKEKKKILDYANEKYGFIFNVKGYNSDILADILQKYIELEKNKVISIDDIKKYISPYLDN
jgi:DNA repair exonuclease SbcCD nuclease subunit